MNNHLFLYNKNIICYNKKTRKKDIMEKNPLEEMTSKYRKLKLLESKYMADDLSKLENDFTSCKIAYEVF